MLLVPVAWLCCDGQRIRQVLPHTYTKSGDAAEGLVCPECDSKLIHKRAGDHRRAHFAHAALTSTCDVAREMRRKYGHGGESKAHLGAKERFLDANFRKRLHLYRPCAKDCGKPCVEFKVNPSWAVRLEYRVENWYIDVALVDATGAPRALIEILHTHKTTGKKLEWLMSSSDRQCTFFEVLAKDVLQLGSDDNDDSAQALQLCAVNDSASKERARLCVQCECDDRVEKLKDHHEYLLRLQRREHYQSKLKDLQWLSRAVDAEKKVELIQSRLDDVQEEHKNRIDKMKSEYQSLGKAYDNMKEQLSKQSFAVNKMKHELMHALWDARSARRSLKDVTQQLEDVTADRDRLLRARASRCKRNREDLDRLRRFDLTQEYGPALGMKRSKRVSRAERFKIDDGTLSQVKQILSRRPELNIVVTNKIVRT